MFTVSNLVSCYHRWLRTASKPGGRASLNLHSIVSGTPGAKGHKKECRRHAADPPQRASIEREGVAEATRPGSIDPEARQSSSMATVRKSRGVTRRAQGAAMVGREQVAILTNCSARLNQLQRVSFCLTVARARRGRTPVGSLTLEDRRPAPAALPSREHYAIMVTRGRPDRPRSGRGPGVPRRRLGLQPRHRSVGFPQRERVWPPPRRWFPPGPGSVWPLSSGETKGCGAWLRMLGRLRGGAQPAEAKPLR
jgi:hypothetical protein